MASFWQPPARYWHEKKDASDDGKQAADADAQQQMPQKTPAKKRMKRKDHGPEKRFKSGVRHISNFKQLKLDQVLPLCFNRSTIFRQYDHRAPPSSSILHQYRKFSPKRQLNIIGSHWNIIHVFNFSTGLNYSKLNWIKIIFLNYALINIYCTGSSEL